MIGFMGSRGCALALVVLMASATAFADLHRESRDLSVREFVVMACYGQGLLRRDRAISLLGLNRTYQASGLSCKKLNSCDEALNETFVGGQQERDGDGDGVPCERLCLVPPPFNVENEEGAAGWNCQILRNALYPELTLDPFTRMSDLERLKQSQRNPDLPPLE